MYERIVTKNDEVVEVPKSKTDYRFKPLEERKKIETYPYTYKVKRNNLKRKTDKYILENLDKLKQLKNIYIIKWVEYMMLWSTFEGWQAEKNTMIFLKNNIPEIEWLWGNEEEDIKGIDIKGVIENSEIWIQVKLVSGARIGFGDIDFEKTIMLYIKNDNNNFYLVPKDHNNALIAYFLKIYCEIKKIDFLDYIKKREKKF